MEIKGNFINYGEYVDVHDNEVVNIQVGGEVKIGKGKFDHFPPCMTYEQGESALRILKENGFVAQETDPMCFLYLMGCTEERTADIRPIRWLKNKQLLREMLELWFKRLLDERSMKKAKMEAMCSLCFVDKEGEAIHLAKNKPVPSYDSDVLTNFFATI